MNFRPFPLRYLYYVGNIPLPRALKDAETLGPATVLGRPCETYLLRRFTLGLSPCDLAYTLDRESGVPLKLVGYNDAAGYTGGRPSWRWEALGVEQFGQTGTIADLYRHHGMDANAIIDAAESLTAGAPVRHRKMAV